MSEGSFEYSPKPHLALYIGRQVIGIQRGQEDWQWAIVLQGGVEIRNKDRRETFVPEGIIGSKLKTITLSEADTTLVFSSHDKWSMTPTQYSIYDPQHGGESYPQWPEELEEAGIPSHPEEEVSQPPTNPKGWEQARKQMERSAQARIESQARDFIQEEDDGA